MENITKTQLPVLPKGQGSFSYKDNLIMFRKVLTNRNGKKIRKYVYAKTVSQFITIIN